MDTCKTVTVVGEKGEPLRINETDFDKSVHKLYEEKKATKPAEKAADIAEVAKQLVAAGAVALSIERNGKTGAKERFLLTNTATDTHVAGAEFKTEMEALTALGELNAAIEAAKAPAA